MPDDTVTLEVLYTCNSCALRRVPCSVPVREPQEDVVVWMQKLQRILSADHKRRSPQCHPKELSEVLIPQTGANYVGGPPVN